MVIVLSLFYWNQSWEKKSRSQTTTSVRQSRISWAEEKIVYLPKEGMQSETKCVLHLWTHLTQHRNSMVPNVLLSGNTTDLTPNSCTDLSLHYICLVAKLIMVHEVSSSLPSWQNSPGALSQTALEGAEIKCCWSTSAAILPPGLLQ